MRMILVSKTESLWRPLCSKGTYFQIIGLNRLRWEKMKLQERFWTSASQQAQTGFSWTNSPILATIQTNSLKILRKIL